MAIHSVGLSAIVGRSASNLSGQERGQWVRAELGLEEFDEANDQVVLEVPEWLTALSPSFVQGLLAPSVRRSGDREAFYSRYSIMGSDLIRRQIDSGVRRILALSRH